MPTVVFDGYKRPQNCRSRCCKCTEASAGTESVGAENRKKKQRHGLCLSVPLLFFTTASVEVLSNQCTFGHKPMLICFKHEDIQTSR